MHCVMDCHVTGLGAGVLTFYRGIASDSSFKSEMQYHVAFVSRDSIDIKCITGK